MVGANITSQVFGNVPVKGGECALTSCDNPKLLEQMMEVYMRSIEKAMQREKEKPVEMNNIVAYSPSAEVAGRTPVISGNSNDKNDKGRGGR